MRIRALKEFRYAGKLMKVGEEFDASDKDADLLKKIRKAEDAPATKRALKRKDLTEEKPAETPVEPAKPTDPVMQTTNTGRGLFSTQQSEGQPARRYPRRDMQAED